MQTTAAMTRTTLGTRSRDVSELCTPTLLKHVTDPLLTRASSDWTTKKVFKPLTFLSAEGSRVCFSSAHGFLSESKHTLGRV